MAAATENRHQFEQSARVQVFPMVAFATELGATVRELHRPMANLKRAGQVRSVGERHRTRYFPGLATASPVEAATPAA